MFGSSTALAPAGATRVDLSGKTVIPGLINAHAHLDGGDEALPMYDRVIQQLRLYAQYGVSTVVTPGDDVAGPAVVARTVEDARQGINRAADISRHHQDQGSAAFPSRFNCATRVC